jgi:hypothetical protein
MVKIFIVIFTEMCNCLLHFRNNNNIFREPGSSGSIVSGYGLDNRAIGVRPPAEAK